MLVFVKRNVRDEVEIKHSYLKNRLVIPKKKNKLRERLSIDLHYFLAYMQECYKFDTSLYF